jgi:hypothetical protein
MCILKFQLYCCQIKKIYIHVFCTFYMPLQMSYVHPKIRHTRQGNTSTIEAIFLCGKVV